MNIVELSKYESVKKTVEKYTEPLICDFCDEPTLEYVQTIMENGIYAIVRQCNNHNVGVGFLEPIDEVTGKILMLFDDDIIKIKRNQKG